MLLGVSVCTIVVAIATDFMQIIGYACPQVDICGDRQPQASVVMSAQTRSATDKVCHRHQVSHQSNQKQMPIQVLVRSQLAATCFQLSHCSVPQHHVLACRHTCRQRRRNSPPCQAPTASKCVYWPSSPVLTTLHCHTPRLPLIGAHFCWVGLGMHRSLCIGPGASHALVVIVSC